MEPAISGKGHSRTYGRMLIALHARLAMPVLSGCVCFSRRVAENISLLAHRVAVSPREPFVPASIKTTIMDRWLWPGSWECR